MIHAKVIYSNMDEDMTRYIEVADVAQMVGWGRVSYDHFSGTTIGGAKHG